MNPDDLIALLNEDDFVAFNDWLDQREAEAIAQESYWEEELYGKKDREIRETYFNENPREKYDSPDIEYPERD
jgi:hypothetical protein